MKYYVKIISQIVSIRQKYILSDKKKHRKIDITDKTHPFTDKSTPVIILSWYNIQLLIKSN